MTLKGDHFKYPIYINNLKKNRYFQLKKTGSGTKLHSVQFVGNNIGPLEVT